MPDHHGAARKSIIFRKPETRDGKYLWKLAGTSKTIDANSPYHYLLMCRVFADTCLVAEKQDRIIGFCTAFIPPGKPDTVFVWQVAVDHRERGQGIGVRIITEIIYNIRALNIKFLDATITASNIASIKLFTSAARQLNAPFAFETTFFDAFDFGQNIHEPEKLFRIGPIPRLI